MEKNHYQILGVDNKASPSQIKSAYRRSVKELHPDYYGQDCRPFQRVQEAYSVLSDTKRRKRYDQELRQCCGPPTRWRGPAKPSPHGPTTVEPIIDLSYDHDKCTSPIEEMAAAGHSFHTIFDSLFSRQGPPQNFKSSQQKRYYSEIVLSEAEAFRGGRVLVSIPLQVQCPRCYGDGHSHWLECERCSGFGILAGQIPAYIQIPSGIRSGYSLSVPLEEYGLPNAQLHIKLNIQSY